MTILSDMINKNGNKEFAYVMLLMLNETYVPGSIVLSESLRNSGCMADLVLMVDKNISVQTVDVLKKFYDKIIHLESDDIIKTKSEDPVQKHILTKLNGLKLDYKKIALIDVDCIIFNESNNVFEYDTPACMYSNNKYNSGMILLEPNLKDFNNLIKLSEQIPKDEPKPLVYLLEQYYKNLYKLDDKYLKSNDSTDAFGIQYNDNKPFIIKNKIPIEERLKWKHFQLWFMYWRNTLNKYPDLEKLECLKDANELLGYYLTLLSRFVIKERQSKDRIFNNHVKNIYNLDDPNSDYYHLDISKEYDSDDITYLFDYISLGSFIKYLKEKTKLLDPYIIIDTESIKKTMKLIEPHYLLDYFLTEYVRVCNNVFVILLVRNIDDEDKNIEITGDLKDNLVYSRNYKFPGIVLKNILFNVYQNYLYDQRVNTLNMYDDYETYDINLLICETKVDMNFNYQKNKIFVFNDTNAKIRLSSIFLNQNTLSRYSDGKANVIKNNKINRKKLKSLLYFQTLKKWLFNTYSGEQLRNIIIIKNKPITILDNNTHDLSDIKKIKQKNIKLIKLIFTSGDKYESNKSKYLKEIQMLKNPNEYWEIEGIKISSKL